MILQSQAIRMTVIVSVSGS